MNVNDLGKTYLVDDCQSFILNDFLKQYKLKLKELFLQSKLELLGNNITLALSKTGNEGTRFWFCCPTCNTRVAILYLHPFTKVMGCRRCLNLEYRKRRYKGMVEGDL